MSSSEDNTKLRHAVNRMHCLSLHGLTEVVAIAELVLISLEMPSGYSFENMGRIADGLKVICSIAEDTKSGMDSESEEVGCRYVDESGDKRISAWRKYRNELRASS